MLKVIIFSLIATALGCVFHFTYEWSHRNRIVAVFSAINESVWEHIKIGVYGMLPIFLVSLFWNSATSVAVAAAAAFMVFMILVPALFYPIEAIMHRHSIPASIIEFAVAVFASMLVFDTFVQGIYTYPTISLGIFLIIVALLASSIFTFYPPKWFLFRDSRNGKYGFDASGRSHHHHH